MRYPFALPTIVLAFMCLPLSTCGPGPAKRTPARTAVVTPISFATRNPSPVPSLTRAGIDEPTDTPALPDQTESWTAHPILPALSERALEVYARGLASRNNPHAFSKVGDGEIASHWFLTIFDSPATYYDLGPYTELSGTIEYFAGSFARDSLAARAGFNTSRILDPLFAMNDICLVEESPLACELRLHRPGFAIISLGTNQVWAPDIFKEELGQIVRICIEKGVVPILATKGDNLEGDHRINAIIAEIAGEYQMPLWNFWLAIQPLPDQGLQADGEHLSWAESDFDNPEALTHAWPVRNLSALQLLASLIDQLANH